MNLKGEINMLREAPPGLIPLWVLLLVLGFSLFLLGCCGCGGEVIFTLADIMLQR